MASPNDTAHAATDRVRQEVERWIDVARTAGERTLEAIGLTPVSRSMQPAVDVLETEEALHVWVDVPGLTTESVQLTATEMHLSVRLLQTATSETGGKFHLRERAAFPCERTIALPVAVNAEQITAHLRDGLLHVTLIKQKTPEPRSVPVNVM